MEVGHRGDRSAMHRARAKSRPVLLDAWTQATATHTLRQPGLGASALMPREAGHVRCRQRN